MIQLYTGDGKGKTTAAIGQGIRACGCGLSVLFTQFMKGNDTGELAVLERLDGVEILRSNQNFGFFRNMTKEEKEKLTEIHNEILREIYRRLMAGEADVVIMDEITYPLNWGLLDENLLEDILRLGKENTRENGLPELVLTGRNPKESLIDRADYLSEIHALRHPYEKGISARRGIEY